MKLLLRTAFLVVILFSGGSRARAADAPCGCMFVKPPKPSGVSVERSSRLLPDPPPLVVFLGETLIIRGTPDADLACQTVNARGQVVTTKVHLTSKPPRQSVPCQATASGSLQDFEKKRTRIDPHLLSADAQAPLIWSPRYGKVLSDHVDFQFNLPDRDASYRLRIGDDEGKKWDTTIKARADSTAACCGKSTESADQPPLTPFRYGDAAEALKAGHSYQLSISKSGLGGVSDDAEFSMIPSEDGERVKQEIAGIDGLQIGDHSKRLLRATVYGAHDLYFEAIAQLRLDPDTPSDPDALRILGDLYRLGKSNRAAEAEYFDSLRPLATANDSAAGRALSHESLGVVHEAMGNTKAAISDYTQAQRLYASFRDSESAKRMADAIALLK